MLRIRKVQREDNERLATVIRAAFDEFEAPKQGTVYSDPTTDHLYELFEESGSVLWVAELDNVVVGCCGIYPTSGLEPDCAELAKFYVLGDARDKGVGKSLLSQSLQSARDLGYATIYLESLPHFDRAVSMYEASGFHRLPAPLGNSGHVSCNIWMSRAL